MNQEIKYNGLSAVPSDYECPDGTLAASLNLINEDNALHPIAEPNVLFHIPKGNSVFCHKTPEYEHFILWNPTVGNPAVLALGKDGSLIDTLSDGTAFIDTILSVNALGNTLVLAGVTNVYYFLWRSEQSRYLYLGTSVPDISLHFHLLGDVVAKDYEGTDLSLKDSSKIQSSQDEWTLIHSLTVNAEYPKANTMGTAGNYTKFTNLIKIEIPDNSIIFKQNTEYRISFVLSEGSANGFEVYTNRQIPSQIGHDGSLVCSDVNRHGHSPTASFLAEESLEDVGFVIFAEVSSPDSGSDKVRGTLSIEQSTREHISIDAKVIEYSQDSYQAVCAAVNSFVAKEATEKNRFIYPFFVRYAVRLFDGSFVNISAPRLMIPNSGYAPTILYRDELPRLSLRAFIARLQFCISELPGLDNWADIISGVSVFVSPSAWPYNQGKEFERDENNFKYSYFKDISSKGFLRLVHNGAECSSGQYTAIPFDRGTQFFSDAAYSPYNLEVAPLSSEEFMGKIAAMSSFYEIATITFDDLNPSSVFTDVEMKEGVLSSLAARPTLSADNQPLAYAGFASASSHVYNNRLHLFNAAVRLPAPDSVAETSPFFYQAGSDADFNAEKNAWDVYVFLRTSQGDRIVRSRQSMVTPTYFFWFFYPDSRAYKAVIQLAGPAAAGYLTRRILPLKRHDFLNGAFFLADSFDNSLNGDSVTVTAADPDFRISVNNTLHEPSNIYLSAPGNPFVFPASHVVGVGARRIVALASATQALSQGQFGQFPLYAFSDEGVWALSVNSVGAYSAVQPVTRDVCLNPSGICQTDSAVLFPTTRGIMMLAGSHTQCLSDAICCDTPFDALSMPEMDKVRSLLHDALNTDVDTCLSPMPFTDFLIGCQMLYDYPHQRVILFNPSVQYAYVLSLKSHLWGMIHSCITAGINSYPDALAVDNRYRIVDFSTTPSDSLTAAMLVTRPLKLGLPDILKTVDTIIQRGHFRRGHLQSVLYGSRDLYSWHLVWSSTGHFLRGFHGTPYKYFRIALLGNLAPDESIFGASVRLTPKLTDKPR